MAALSASISCDFAFCRTGSEGSALSYTMCFAHTSQNHHSMVQTKNRPLKTWTVTTRCRKTKVTNEGILVETTTENEAFVCTVHYSRGGKPINDCPRPR